MELLFFSLLLFFSINLSADNHIRQMQLHTLFTSEAVRNQLNTLRNTGKYNPLPTAQSNASSPTSVSFKMQGVLIRKNKPPVVFVKHNNTLGSQHKNRKFQVLNPSDISNDYMATFFINNQKVKLKPGQQWTNTEQKSLHNIQTNPPNFKIHKSINDVNILNTSNEH